MTDLSHAHHVTANYNSDPGHLLSVGLVITQDKRLCAAFFFVLFLNKQLNSRPRVVKPGSRASFHRLWKYRPTLFRRTLFRADSEQLSLLLVIPTRSSWVLLSLAVPALELPN
jgi:hypothetical protein